MARIMTADEARKRRGGTTLVERTKRDPVRAAQINAIVAEASVEQLLQRIMELEHVTAAELARRMNAKPPQISRDLHGGLSRATLSRLVMIAEALGYDFMPAFVPRTKDRRREKFIEAYRGLIPNVPAKASAPVKSRTGLVVRSRSNHTKSVDRKIA